MAGFSLRHWQLGSVAVVTIHQASRLASLYISKGSFMIWNAVDGFANPIEIKLERFLILSENFIHARPLSCQ